MISISLKSSVPIHDQLVAEFRRLIATGELKEGDELPPVRQLAADLGVNMNTVARAYRALTESGLLASSRGRGTVVISTVERPPGRPEEERRRIDGILAGALANAKIAGLSRRETQGMLERQLRRLWSPT